MALVGIMPQEIREAERGGVGGGFTWNWRQKNEEL